MTDIAQSSRLRSATPVAARVGAEVWAHAQSLRCRYWLAAVGLVAFGIRLTYMIGPVNARFWPDSGTYVGMANDVLHGHGFQTGTEMRTPAYPLLIDAVALIEGRPVTDAGVAQTIVVIQHLVGVAVAVGITWAAWRYFGRLAGVLTGLLAATSPVSINLENDLMPDYLLGAIAVGGALLLARGVESERPRYRWIAAAGVTFGIAALVKPVGQACFLAALVPILVAPRRWRTGVRAGALLAACLFVTISPWLIRNEINYGSFKMSDQDGPALWLRVFDWDKRPFPTSQSGQVAQRLYTQALAKMANPDARPTTTYEFVLEALQSPPINYTEQQASAFQRSVALQAIVAAPGAFVANTWSVFKDLATLDLDRYWARMLLASRDAGHTITGEMTARLAHTDTPSFAAFGFSKHVLKWLWLLSIHMAAIVLLPFTRSRMRRVGALAFGLTWVALLVATSVTTFPDHRYSSQSDALVWPLVAAAAALVATAIVRQVRGGLRRANAQQA